MSEDAGFAEQLRRVETLVAAVEATVDPAAQANMRELLQAVLELHRRGIARMLELGPELTGKLSRDELVSSLLLLHDLHPDDLGTRARRALASVEAKLLSEGCTAVLTVEGGAVRVRLERRTYGHYTTGASLSRLTEEALQELCPDADGISIEAEIEPPRAEPVPLVKLRVPSSEAGSAA